MSQIALVRDAPFPLSYQLLSRGRPREQVAALLVGLNCLYPIPATSGPGNSTGLGASQSISHLDCKSTDPRTNPLSKPDASDELVWQIWSLYYCGLMSDPQLYRGDKLRVLLRARSLYRHDDTSLFVHAVDSWKSTLPETDAANATVFVRRHECQARDCPLKSVTIVFDIPKYSKLSSVDLQSLIPPPTSILHPTHLIPGSRFQLAFPPPAHEAATVRYVYERSTDAGIFRMYINLDENAHLIGVNLVWSENQ